MQLVAKLVAPPDGRVTLVSVAEILAPSSHGPAVGGIRSTIAREVRRINAERAKAAMKALNRAAAALKRSGWRTHTHLRTGEPLRELMAAVGTAEPELLVVGARGTSGVRQLLLGSVAEGVLNRSPFPCSLHDERLVAASGVWSRALRPLSKSARELTRDATLARSLIPNKRTGSQHRARNGLSIHSRKQPRNMKGIRRSTGYLGYRENASTNMTTRSTTSLWQ